MLDNSVEIKLISIAPFQHDWHFVFMPVSWPGHLCRWPLFGRHFYVAWICHLDPQQLGHYIIFMGPRSDQTHHVSSRTPVYGPSLNGTRFILEYFPFIGVPLETARVAPPPIISLSTQSHCLTAHSPTIHSHVTHSPTIWPLIVPPPLSHTIILYLSVNNINKVAA